MRDWPKTIEEANTRIVAYYDKLIDQGYSHPLAYNAAIDSYKKYLKPRFAVKEGEIIDICVYCYSPIIHPELYTVCADGKDVDIWHVDCKPCELNLA